MKPALGGISSVNNRWSHNAHTNPIIDVWLLGRLMDEQDLPGVMNSYLYFGMWRALFGVHCEGAPRSTLVLTSSDRKSGHTSWAHIKCMV